MAVVGRRQQHPTPVLLPGKSLVGCSPWGHCESDTTEQLYFHFSLSCIEEGHGNPLQCSCLENPRDGGTWWAAIYGVTQSWTQLKRLSSSSSSMAVVPCTQSCLALCNLVDGSMPGSSAHGISQSRILERVAVPRKRESSQPRDQTKPLASPTLAGRFFTMASPVVVVMETNTGTIGEYFPRMGLKNNCHPFFSRIHCNIWKSLFFN